MALRGAGLQYLGQSIAQAGQQFAQIPILREQANRQRIQDERDTLKFGKEMEAADLNTQYIKTNMAATQASTQAAQEKAAQGQRNLSGEADLSAALQGDPEAGARLVQLVVAEMQKAGFQINPPTTRKQAGLKGPSAQALEGMGMEQAPPQAPAGLNPQLRPQASTPMVGMGSQSPMAARRQQLSQEALDEMGAMQYQGMGDMEPGAKYTSLSNRFSGSQSPVVEKAIDRAQEDMQNEANRQSAEERALAAAHAKKLAATLGDGRNDSVRFEKWRAEISGSPQFKTLKNTSMAADDALRLLSEGNPAVDGTVVVKIARMMGESGVLSDQDMKRIGGDVSFFQKLADKMSKGTEGTMSAHNRQLFTDLAQLIKDKSELKLDELMELHRAEGYGRADRTLVDNALKTLRYTSAFAEGAPATTTPPGKASTPAAKDTVPGAQPQNETPEQRRERLRRNYVK